MRGYSGVYDKDQKKNKTQDTKKPDYRMPCFICNLGCSCKYYQNTTWDVWILYTKQCPISLGLPFESVFSFFAKEE